MKLRGEYQTLLSVWANLMLGCLLLGTSSSVLANPIDSLRQAIDIHQDKGHSRALLNAYLELAEAYKQSYQHKASAETLKLALPIAREEKDQDAIFSALNDLGWMNFWLDAYPQALEYLFRAREIAVEHLPLRAQSTNLSRIAQTYISLGNYQQALYHQLQALTLSEQIDDSLGMATSYHYIGSIYYNREQYDLALKHMRQALRIYNNTGHDIEIYTITAFMSSIYTKQGFLSRAMDYAQRSLELAQSIEYPYGMAFSTGLIGSIEKEKGDPQKAIPYLSQSIDMMNGLNVQAEQAEFMIIKAEAFLQQKAFDSAAFMLYTALGRAQDIHSLKLVEHAAQTMSQVYEAKGNQDSAFHYLKWYNQTQDSLKKQVNLDQLNNLETEFEIRRKQDQIEALEKQRRTDRITFYVFGLGLSFILLIVVIWLLYVRYRTEAQTSELLSRKNREIQQRNEQLSLANAELGEFAEVAISDLRSPLQEIQGLLTKPGADLPVMPKVYKLLSRMEGVLTGLSMYAILGKQNPTAAPVDMNEVISEAIQLLPEALRQQATRIHVKPLPPVLGHRRQLVQLLQQLLNNSIKYRAEAEPRIEIQGIPAGDMHLFSVRDNGKGMNPDQLTQAFGLFYQGEEETHALGKGIGLAVCRKIIEQHGGQIWVESRTEVGSTFFFTLPPALPEAFIEPKPAPEVPERTASDPNVAIG